ncbi:mandelate racemase/muconate lactonizing enzyme family protein [Dactylosporangium sp. CA-139066]|uniref:mandelate racemase/muconate lactonizing enzyme family protein n=1 Tax=Dactylosporangium sp. CA-139066 TaxID=3239930 RepID=UPI003D8DB81D
MRIVRVCVTPVATARHTGITSRHLIVELATDHEITGYGELSDAEEMAWLPDLGILTAELNAILVGADPADRVDLLARLDGRFGTADPVVRWAVEIALYDLLGRAFGTSVCDLLGGRKRDAMPVGYPMFPMYDRSIAQANLAEAQRRIGQGFTLFKVYVCGNLEVEEWFFDEARDRFGDAFTVKCLDLSARFPPSSALHILRRLLPRSGALSVESPVRRGNPDALAAVRRQLPVPVSEHVWSHGEARRLLDADAVDILNISLAALGGFSAALEVFALARHADVGTLIGGTQELSIGSAAALHLAAAVDNLDFAGDTVGPMVYRDDVTAHPVQYRDGHALVPDGPGLGVTVDPARLAALTSPLHART